jgi:lipopolysaccharide transport system ATP-binding protein
MAVRLAFAVIAHVDADILVIDEALSVGDAIFTQKCMRFINDFKNHGTILFVSHDIGAISSISSRTVWFSRGQIAFMGETAYVVDRYHQYALQEIAAENKNKEPISEIEIKKINSTLQEDDLGNQINPKSVIVGQGKALIVKAGIFNVTGESVNVFTGNEKIRLTYLIEVKKKISGFLVGFTIKDRLGLKIIEENNSTYNDASDLKVVDACFIRVNFEYRMPYLKAGIYSVDLSIAEGTQESHKPQAWIYDAIQIEFNPIHEVFGMVTTGLISFNLEAVNG